MKIFVLMSARAYSLDAVIPIIYELRGKFPDLQTTVICPRKETFDELKENVVLYNQIVYDGQIEGKIVKMYNDSGLYVSSVEEKVMKFIQLLPTLLKMLVSRKSIFFCPRYLEFKTGLMSKINGLFGGKTFCYLADLAPKKINKRWKESLKTREKPGRVDVGDGLLAYSADDTEFLFSSGYKKNLFIGYSFMYPTFQKGVRESWKFYLGKECDFWDYTIVSIFLNKYHGFTSGQSITWARKRLCEAIDVIREKFPNSYILIRTHPMVGRVMKATIDVLGIKNVKRTNLHIYTLACASKFIVSIAPSSSPILAMAFDCPVIEYGLLENREEFYKAFPKGSLYSDYGVQTAFTPTGLKRTIDRLDESEEWLKTFHRELNDRPNLKFFEEYWG